VNAADMKINGQPTLTASEIIISKCIITTSQEKFSLYINTHFVANRKWKE
jgi:hypothetical protein